jgi:hypothetical protein
MVHIPWAGDLSAAERTLAFGNADGQLGFTILRKRTRLRERLDQDVGIPGNGGAQGSGGSSGSVANPYPRPAGCGHNCTIANQ